MVRFEEIRGYVPEMIENYKYLHQHPELGFEEKETSAYVLKKLEEYGIKGRQIAGTGIMAEVEGKNGGRTIAIRADMDALPIEEQSDLPYRSQNPGRMHACGHDSHTAMLLCAARYFADNGEKLNGKVRLIFQPAEEGASSETMAAIAAEDGSYRGGAARMIRYGALEGVDACFALHVNPMYPSGTLSVSSGRVSASSDIFELTIQGKGGHGSSPENTIDPIGALAAVIAAYNALPAREISALDSCSLSIGAVRSGEAWNVIPDSAYVTGGLRSFSNEMRMYIFKRLEEIANGICAAHRCSVQFVRHEGYAPTINSEEISKEMYGVAQKVLGADQVILLDKPMMGSEDVGYYFQEVPGAIGWLGVMSESGPVAPHNPKFKINLDALPCGVLLHVNMVLDYLNK